MEFNGVPIDVPFTELNKLIEPQLKGRHFPDDGSGSVDVEVLRASITAAGDRFRQTDTFGILETIILLPSLVFFGMWPARFTVVLLSVQTEYQRYWPTRMQIGPVALRLVVPCMVMLSFLVVTWFPGVPRSSPLCLDPVPSPNIVLLLILM
jgi:hypothetical protein